MLLLLLGVVIVQCGLLLLLWKVEVIGHSTHEKVAKVS